MGQLEVWWQPCWDSLVHSGDGKTSTFLPCERGHVSSIRVVRTSVCMITSMSVSVSPGSQRGAQLSIFLYLDSLCGHRTYSETHPTPWHHMTGVPQSLHGIYPADNWRGCNSSSGHCVGSTLPVSLLSTMCSCDPFASSLFFPLLADAAISDCSKGLS